MANRSLNRVMLIGNLTRDPELRYTPSGVALCSFGLATNRRWNDAEGNVQESTEFHRIVAWAKLAELCSQLLFKGRKVYLGGRLQTREWTDKDGNRRTTTEIVIDNMLILDSKRKEEAVGEASVEPAEKPAAAEKEVKEAKKEAKGEKGEKGEKEEVNKEDIPF